MHPATTRWLARQRRGYRKQTAHLTLGLFELAQRPPGLWLASLTYLQALGEIARNTLKQKVHEGLTRAQQAGVRLGRPRVHVSEDHLRATATLSIRQAAKALGVSTTHTHRLRQQLGIQRDYQRPVGRRAHWRRQQRIRANGGRHTDAEWRALLRRYGFCCAWCGTHVSETPEGYLTKDHRRPLSRGGSDAIENIDPLCWTCNRTKGTSLR